MVRQSYTAVIERNVVFEEVLTTEPYECGWASEAIFYVRKLEASGLEDQVVLWVQISPDGMHWCNEGTTLRITGAEVDCCKVTHFGNWLRLRGDLPVGARVKVIVTLALKE